MQDTTHSDYPPPSLHDALPIYFQLDEIRRSHGNGSTVEQGHGVDHLLLHPVDGVADRFLVRSYLLEGTVSGHEVPELAVGVQVLHVAVHDVGTFQGVTRLEGRSEEHTSELQSRE